MSELETYHAPCRVRREHEMVDGRWVASEQRITTRNARFQQWLASLSNRNKRQRLGEFLVQGVRPITLARQHGWTVNAILYDPNRTLSSWAQDVLASTGGERYALAAELLTELGEKNTDAPELIAVVKIPDDDWSRISVPPTFLGVVLDRPTNPGNLGSIIRSADAFGAEGVIVTGHAADLYDSATVRASTGSLFAVPTIRAASPRDVIEWVSRQREAGIGIEVIGTDEIGDVEVFATTLVGPVLIVVGNETVGMSAGWRDAVDQTVRIPIRGSASSLNASNAASILLYEAARQRQRI